MVKKRPVYKPLSDAERERVAHSCEKGQNGHREQYAREIRAGDLFRDDGYPRSYWHCLATEKPDDIPSRRGQWVATPISYAGEWIWQDWGPIRAEPSLPDYRESHKYLNKWRRLAETKQEREWREYYKQLELEEKRELEKQRPGA